MSVYIYPQQMLPAVELITTMSGSNKLIGTLLHPPVKLILDNQSTTAVVLSVQLPGGGQVSWKTFSAGEALILDDDLYTFPSGTSFYGNGAENGSFSISYTYINQ